MAGNVNATRAPYLDRRRPDSSRAGRDRATAGEAQQGPTALEPAGDSRERHLEPVAQRLTAHGGQLPRQTTGNYWPGARWVDWLGTDFYSQYPAWKDLNRFYRAKRWKRKPVAVTEWAVSGEDQPRFVKQLITWIAKRPRVRMFVYYDGFGAANETPYDLRLFPRAADTVRLKVRRPNFLEYAEYNAGAFPPLAPKPPP